jgi:ubiquinone/menaquinone biosynthesis C-methylase UbiE
MAVMKSVRHKKDVEMPRLMARFYDKNTRKHRIGEMQEYANETLKHIKEGATVLDIATGPGFMPIELAKIGNFNITGMDISADFIEICKTNAKNENVRVDFVQGNVSALPFEDNAFDFVFCSAAFKNFKEPIKALNEMYRVLKNDGIALIIDMNRAVSKEMLQAEAERVSKSGFERWFMKITFKQLGKAAYTKDEFHSMIKDVPFSKSEIKESGISLYVYLWK